MYATRTRARLLPGADNPLGERDFDVALYGISLELHPVIEDHGAEHELRLVSFPRRHEPAFYAYDHQRCASDGPTLTMFARP